ncbi:MAG: ABC transporter permease, partial [Thermodesulfobacteriota bacterium]
MSFEYFIGRRYLMAKQRQAFISLITILSIAGVTVGVMALIVVIAVMSGFESDLKSRILMGQPHLVLMHHGGPFADYRRIQKQIETIEDVEATTPFIYSQVMLRSSSGVSGAVLRGVDPKSAGNVIESLKNTPLNEEIEIKREDLASTVSGIVLGRELAKNLGIQVNDFVYLITPKGMISPMGHMPSMRRFQVAGLFESGMYEYDGTFAYIHLRDAQNLMRMGETVTGIEVRVKNLYQARKIADQIVDKLGFPFWARDWMQM